MCSKFQNIFSKDSSPKFGEVRNYFKHTTINFPPALYYYLKGQRKASFLNFPTLYIIYFHFTPSLIRAFMCSRFRALYTLYDIAVACFLHDGAFSNLFINPNN
jgi:hypothetical protein